MKRSIASAPAAAIAHTQAASGQSANGAAASMKPPTAGPTVPGEPPRERVHREVAAAQVRGPDVGDERLVRGAVEALADPEHRQQRRRTATNAAVPVEPATARVDEQPG